MPILVLLAGSRNTFEPGGDKVTGWSMDGAQPVGAIARRQIMPTK